MNEEKRKAETEAEVRYRLVVSRELDDINVHDHDFSGVQFQLKGTSLIAAT